MRRPILLGFILLMASAIAPPANSALFDVTTTPWDFNARIFNGAIGFHSVFDDSLLQFDEQVSKSGGGAFLGGQISWRAGGKTVAVTNLAGEFFPNLEFVLIGNTGGILTAFRGLVTEDGDLLLGELGGFGGSNLHGFFWATPVSIPSSGILMGLAIGGWLLVGTLRRSSKRLF